MELKRDQGTNKNIIFHIGLEKTGTTSFQKFSTVKRAELLRHSVLYPTNKLTLFKNNHSPLVACYLPENGVATPIAPTSQRDKEAVLRALRCEIEEAGADKVLISAEHFSSRFLAPQVHQLATDFSDYCCRVVIVVRDHAARILSAYYSTITNGRHLTIDEYIDELCDSYNIYARYRETIAQWESVFGKENIIVVPYVEGENIITNLMKTLISPDFKISDDASYLLNRSEGAAMIEARRRVNEEMSARREGDPSKHYFGYCLENIRRVLEKRAFNDSHNRLRLSEDQRRRLDAIAEGDRRWLEERYHVRLENQPSGGMAHG